MAEEGAYSSANMDEKNLLDYCRVIWKRRGLITALCVTSILVSAAYTFWVPNFYRATATILPPKEFGSGIGNQMPSSLGVLFSMGRNNREGRSGDNSLGSLFSGGGQLFTPATPERDTYVAILNSRTMLQEVVEHLKKKWGPSVGSLIDETEVSLSEDGVISVTVEAQDITLSAEAANYFFVNLSTSLSRRSKATAIVQKEYYERQLDRTRQELKKAQEALIKFQEKNRYIALDPATRSAIESGAMSAGSVMSLEMERNLKRNYLTENHPEMIALNRRIFEAKKLLSHRLYGEPQPLPPETPGAPPRKEFFVASAKMTPLQFKLVEVYRNLTFRQAVENSIHQSLESLKYTIENPPATYIDWLDRAIPPLGPYRPILSFNMAVAGVGSLVVGILLAFFLEYVEQIRILDRRKQLEITNSK